MDVGTAGGGESDAELWHRLRSADEDAFRDLFLRHSTAVYNFFFRRTASWSVARTPPRPPWPRCGNTPWGAISTR